MKSPNQSKISRVKAQADSALVSVAIGTQPVIHRFSSRRQQLAQSFLTQRLHGAQAYDRIAGYFSSSMLEVAGEALETMSGPVRVVCNSELDARDVATARAANYALSPPWSAAQPDV